MPLLTSVLFCLLLPAQDASQPDSVTALLRAGKLEQAVETAQKNYAAHPDDAAVKANFIRLHVALASRMMRDQQFAAAERVLAAVLKVDPDQAEAKRMTETIRAGRAKVPARIKEARQYLRLEWFETAYEILDESAALLPDRRGEWTDDLLAAAEG